MTDKSVNISVRSHRRRATQMEYKAYFAIIFVYVLPVTLLSWAFGSLRERRLSPKGPISRALTKTRSITPMIFSA